MNTIQNAGFVCLTGDVHHRSLNTREAILIDPRSEVQLSHEYIEIAASHGLKVTLFLTGRALEEEWGDCRQLIGRKGLELGAHTFDAFTPLWLHRLAKLVRGSYWISLREQRCDIARTAKIFRERIGCVRSWRTHSYEYDQHTVQLLAEHGFTFWSDIIDNGTHWPRLVDDGRIVAVPINVREDHSSVFHGYLTPDYVAAKQRRRRLTHGLRRTRAAGGMPLDPEAWEAAIRQDIAHSAQRGMAVMNLHPVCMYLIDRFATFERLCQFMATYVSVTLAEAGGRIRN